MDASLGVSLLSFLAEVPDPRSRHGRRHPLTAILALVCCALMSGAKSYAAIGQWGEEQDIALMHRLGFTRTPPKSGGIRKVLIALDKTRFEDALTRWAEARRGRPVASTPLEAVALDGKSVRGSFDGLEKAVHLLSFVGHESGLTLAQTAVPNGAQEKTNEHKTAVTFLQGRDLKRRVVTGDAIFCQRDLSQQVVDAEGHFLWFVKENQPTLLRDIEAAFAPSVEGAFSPSAATDVGGIDGLCDDPRQGTRPLWAADTEGDHGLERLPGLARSGTGRSGRKRGDAGRQDDPRGAHLRHQCAAVGGGRGDVVEVGTRPLVDRDPPVRRPPRRQLVRRRRGRLPSPRRPSSHWPHGVTCERAKESTHAR
jgi:hypothetical protein